MNIPSCTILKAGIPKIEIPVRLKDLNESTIEYYLPECLSALYQNAKKIKFFKDFVDGTHQDIDNFVYDDKSSGKAQNRIKENHAYELVMFKVGFLLGNKKQFANKENVNNDDMAYLDKFMCDVNYYTKDLELRENIYSTGISTSFIMPRGDIFTERESGDGRKVEYSDDYDVMRNSPFIYEVVNSEENAVVYSSCIGESGLKDLFCFNVANIYDFETKKPERVVTVYTREAIYEYRKIGGANKLTKIADNVVYGRLPMTEHSSNNTRVGIIEIVYDLLNAVNNILSHEVNGLEDKVNQLLVFVNSDVEQTDIDTLYSDGVVCLPPSLGGSVNPDVKSITNQLNFSETSVLMERVLTRLFDIAGVPLASASVSSGNNEAAYLGGGWTNATTNINRDILYFEQADREELRKIIKICKLNAENPINELNANEIVVKYNVNQSNNLLTKTQAMQNLYDMKVPLIDILKAIPLFGDVHTVATRWQESIDAAKEAETMQETTQDSDSVYTSNEQPTGDNLKGQQKQQLAAQSTAQKAESVI